MNHPGGKRQWIEVRQRRRVCSIILAFIFSLCVLAFIPAHVAAEAITTLSVENTAVCSRHGDPAEGVRASSLVSYSLFLPLGGRDFSINSGCAIPGSNFGTVAIFGSPTDRPAAEHADLNLLLRGWAPTNAYLGRVDYGGAVDSGAPQLDSLFAVHRLAAFSAAYRVYDWNWGCNCRGALLNDYPVTLAGMVVTPTETIHVPTSGYDIGLAPAGYAVMVLYASPSSVTLKYSREDNVVDGYTLHVDNVCVEPTLLALYNSMNSAGRSRLPALGPHQAFGRAIGTELRVAIRDDGTFLDPRSQGDWWQGQ